MRWGGGEGAWEGKGNCRCQRLGLMEPGRNIPLLFSLKKHVSVIVNSLYGEIPSVGELRIEPS